MQKLLFILSSILFTTFSTFAANYPAKKTITKPIIDGNQNDNCWTTADWAPIDQLWVGTTAVSSNFTGRFKVAWDDSLVYILAEVTDNIFHDTHSNPLDNYWNDDCIEIFVDENKSGGNHEFSFNAFAYHVSPFGDVVDNNTTGAALFNKNLKIDVDTNGNVYTWEVAMKIYNDKFDPNNLNLNRVNLTTGKIMGFSMAYNDSDAQNTREHMYGSQVITAADKNISYKTADAFGSLELIANPLGFSDELNIETSAIFYDYENKRLILNLEKNIKQLNIYSLEGKEFKSINALQLNVSSINLESLPTGIYLINTMDENGNTSNLKVAIR